MEKRDLKADLAQIEHMDMIFPESTGDFVRDVIVKHALQRAIAAEEEIGRLRHALEATQHNLIKERYLSAEAIVDQALAQGE